MGSVEKAQLVVKLTKADELVKYMTDSSSKQIEQDLAAGNPKDVKRLMNAIHECFLKHNSVMLDIVVSGMVSFYSDDELDAMINFYSSELGKSIINKQAELNSFNMSELNSYNKLIVYPDLKRAVDKVLDQIETEIKAEEELENQE